MAFSAWKDRVTATPHRYKLTEVAPDTYDLEAVPGAVSEAGTPVNAENLDKLIQRDGDDIKDTVVAFTEAGARANIATGESTATLFGKIKKYFTDLKTHSFVAPSTTQGTGTTTVPCDNILKESSFARVYRNFTDINAGYSCDTPIETVIANMAVGSYLIADTVANGSSVYPSTYGILEIAKHTAGRVSCTFTRKQTDNTVLYYVGSFLDAHTPPWSGWKQVIDNSSYQKISGVKEYSVSPLVPTTPSGPSAAVNKTYADTKAPIANPSFTGVMSCNTTLIGKYRLVPTTNSLNYYKFATVTLGTTFHAKIEGIISYHPYAGDGYVGSAKIEIALRANTLAIDIKGNSDYPVLARIGTLYATMTSDFIVSLYYKQGGQYCLPTLTITGGLNNASVTYEQTDTGSTSAPVTPSGGIAVEFPYTSYKKISTTHDAETITGIKTYATGATPLITDQPTTDLMAVNKAYCDSRSSVYDQVIRTQAEFNTLIASATWLDATSVAIVGQFTLSEANNGGVKIPATVKIIHGYNSAKITITNFEYNYSTGKKGGLWYDNLPNTAGYEIRNMEVDLNGTGTDIIAFYQCRNLSNCTGTGTGTGNGYGFAICHCLSNCTGTGTGTGNGYGFSNIYYAVNCKDGGSSTDMWAGDNINIDTLTCHKTATTTSNTTLNA